MNYDAIIVGAGISGLVAAYRLHKMGRNILLIENTDRVGGAIHSIEAEGFLIEKGPNSFRGTHELLDLVEELGLEEELVTGNPNAPAYVYAGGKLHAVPMSFFGLIKSGLISAGAKVGLLLEPFRQARNESDEESVTSFFKRRIGSEVTDRIVVPFLNGIFAGDPEKLSFQACFPRLAAFESDAGSITRGMIMETLRSKEDGPERSLKPYRLCSFRKGLSTLTDKLAQEIGENLLKEARITKIINAPTGQSYSFQVTIESRNREQRLACRNLIIATPAFAAAQLLEGISKKISGHLAEIPYISLISLPLAYNVDQVSRPLDGFGFLKAGNEELRILGSIWNTSLFQGRAPRDRILTTNFIGGAFDPEAISLNDEVLIEIVHNNMAEVLGIKDEPIRLPITRYEKAIPQYNLGHANRVKTIDHELESDTGLWLAGNYLHGISLGDCVKNAEELAQLVSG